MSIRLGVIGHRGYEGLTDILGLLVREAKGLGLALSFEEELLQEVPGGAKLGRPDQLDALLTLGGDGTLLRGARYVGGNDTQIFGVNLGRLGFLTACGRDEFSTAIRTFAKGEHEVETRMALSAASVDAEGVVGVKIRALNDVVVHKGGFARVLRLRVFADDELIGAFAADGVVIATPTGSTAYSLSAYGPIVAPGLESLLITPVAPHTLALRPTILPPGVALRVEIEDAPEDIVVTADGQVGTRLAVGQSLTVHRSAHPVKLVRFPGSTFFTRLRAKLGWGGLADRDS